MSTAIGTQLANARRAAGMTQCELSVAAHVSLRTIGLIEGQAYRAKPETLARLIAALGSHWTEAAAHRRTRKAQAA